MNKDISIYDALDDIRKQYSVVLTTLSTETARANKAEGIITAMQIEKDDIKAKYHHLLKTLDACEDDLDSYMRSH